MRVVVVYRGDGLGSRLMAFANGLRLARVFGVPCYLTWNEPDHVGGITDPGRLLDMRRLPNNVRIVPLFSALKNIGPARIYYDGVRGIVDREALADADVLLCGLAHIQRLSDEADTPELRKNLAAAMACLVPAPALADRARAFNAECDVRDAVGVHVRRGDIVGHRIPRERVRLIGIDRYFAVLDAVASDRPLFLCTEDQSVVDAFAARYPGRVLRYPTRSWSRDDAVAVEDAMIEMFLLSATKFIVAGPSAFNRFAAARKAIPLVLLQNRDSVQQSIALAIAAVRDAGAGAQPRAAGQIQSTASAGAAGEQL